jgi:hypothetical protein
MERQSNSFFRNENMGLFLPRKQPWWWKAEFSFVDIAVGFLLSVSVSVPATVPATAVAALEPATAMAVPVPATAMAALVTHVPVSHLHHFAATERRKASHRDWIRNHS